MQSPYLPVHGQRAASSDTVDVADVARTVRRQWRAVLGCLTLGLVIGAGIVAFAPNRFDGKASLLARPSKPSTGSISGRITGLGELLGGMGSLGTSGTIETELQVLRSRAIAGKVVDSLQLQIRVRTPRGVSPLALVTSSEFPGTFAPRTYEFRRLTNGAYEAEAMGKRVPIVPGLPARLDVGTITLRESGLPERFTLRVTDREDAITRMGRRLTASKAGGEIAKVVYRGDDSVTAAAGANAVVKFYLDRHRTTDRGANQRRVEFVSAQLGQTAAELAKVESDLRKYQEASGVFDAEVMGQVEIQSSASLRNSLTQLQVDEAGIRQLLAQADSGRITSRDLVAYPSFIRGSAVSPLAQQLSDLEGQRIRLLERRTERDPEIRALDETMRHLEQNIISTARSYANSVSRQREQMQARHDSIQLALLALPAAGERVGRLQRDVKRLSTMYTALEAQLIEARLAAIGEGGEVRQLDVAMPQRQAAFPKPWLTMGIGAGGGLLVGMIVALLLGWFGRWLRDPVDIERALGVSAQRIDPSAPLLIGGAPGARTVLVVPLGAAARVGAGVVAQRLVRTAQQRVIQAAVLDMSDSTIDGNGKLAFEAAQVGATIDRMEQDNAMTIVQLPDLSSDVTLAALRENRPVLLVAPPGPVDRVRLGHAVDTLRRMQVPIAGVVISDRIPSRPRALI